MERLDGHDLSRPVLPGFFRVIPMGDGVQIRSAGRVIRLSGAGVGEAAPRLLGALDGRSTTAELAERLSLDLSVVESLVGRLSASGVVQDAAAWDQASAPVTVRDHLAELGIDPIEVHGALARARIAFVGLGPVARLAARHLAAAGVGELVLVDDGAMDDHDDGIAGSSGAPSVRGRPRAEVVAEECEASPGGSTRVSRRPEPAAVDADSAERLLAEVDLVVVEAVEVGEPGVAFNLACLQGGGRVLPYSATSREAFVGPLVEQPGDPCYLCAQTRRLSHLRHHDAYVAYRAAVADGAITPPQPALLPAHTGIVAGLLALEALRIAGGFASPATAKAVLVADFATLEVNREEVLAVPGCAACGQEETILPRSVLPGRNLME